MNATKVTIRGSSSTTGNTAAALVETDGAVVTAVIVVVDKVIQHLKVIKSAYFPLWPVTNRS